MDIMSVFTDEMDAALVTMAETGAKSEELEEYFPLIPLFLILARARTLFETGKSKVLLLPTFPNASNKRRNWGKDELELLRAYHTKGLIGSQIYEYHADEFPGRTKDAIDQQLTKMRKTVSVEPSSERSEGDAKQVKVCSAG